jgi:hypothetical protein
MIQICYIFGFFSSFRLNVTDYVNDLFYQTTVFSKIVLMIFSEKEKIPIKIN